MKVSSWPALALGTVVGLGTAAVAASVLAHAQDDRAAQADAKAAATPAVTVQTVQRASVPREWSWAGRIEAANHTEVHARVPGYLHSVEADIGTRVVAGQVLARVDTPELDQQIRRAEADLARAEAEASLAQSHRQRSLDLVQSGFISAAGAEERVRGAEVAQAQVQAMRAELARLQQVAQWRVLRAPFTGVVSAREANLGALVGPGSGSAAPLFRITQTGDLHAVVDIPQAQAAAIQVGTRMRIALPEQPGATIEGTVARHSGTLDASNRMLRTEIQLPADSTVVAGSFVNVTLPSPEVAAPRAVVPISALMVDARGTRVATVVADGSQHRLALREVQLGRELGATIEVVDGLQGGERVAVNARISFVEGLNVQPVEVATTGAPR
jgi:RND family efflux transporter MFP subunit